MWITRPPTLPVVSPSLSAIIDRVVRFQIWKHKSIGTSSLHHLMPYEDRLHLHKKEFSGL